MNFSSQGKRLCLDDFKSSLEGLNKSNRWAQLGDTLPWDEIEKSYNKRLNDGKRGAGNKSARMIIGALVIKHKMNLSDEETILAIQENPYMQYFVVTVARLLTVISRNKCSKRAAILVSIVSSASFNG